METRRTKPTDVREFARRLVLSKEYEGTLRRRVFSGQISRRFAKTLLGYAASSPQPLWLNERPAIDALRKIADGEAGN